MTLRITCRETPSRFVSNDAIFDQYGVPPEYGKGPPSLEKGEGTRQRAGR